MTVLNLPAKKRRRPYNMTRAMLHRQAKLGEAIMIQIRGTTLDSADEMDELIMLNRGAEPGELTDIVKQLVADAVAGKQVSARAHAVGFGMTRYAKQDLMGAWNKRMVFVWTQASVEERTRLIEFLIEQTRE